MMDAGQMCSLVRRLGNPQYAQQRPLLGFLAGIVVLMTSNVGDDWATTALPLPKSDRSAGRRWRSQINMLSVIRDDLRT